MSGQHSAIPQDRRTASIALGCTAKVMAEEIGVRVEPGTADD